MYFETGFSLVHLHCGLAMFSVAIVHLHCRLAMFSVAGDGVNLREADTDPGWNEMSVYSAEYLNTCSSYDHTRSPGPGPCHTEYLNTCSSCDHTRSPGRSPGFFSSSLSSGFSTPNLVKYCWIIRGTKIQWGTKWEGPKRKYTNNVHFFILANIKVEVYPLIPNILGAGRKYQKPAMKLSTCLGITGSRADVLFEKISSKLVQRKVNGKNKRCILCRKPFQSYLFDGES